MGAVGGTAAAAVSMIVLTALTSQHAPAAAANAVGAVLVRWLQSAAPDALERVYADATAGGLLVTCLAGALTGAVFGALSERRGGLHPIALGLGVGVVCWAALKWAVAPALDPLMARTFDDRALLAACLVYGALIGFWVQAGREPLGAASAAPHSPPN
jgi:hypothetical protein